MRLLQRPDILCTVLLCLFDSLSVTLGCVQSIVVYRNYATFELPATPGDQIKTEVILMVHELLGQQNSGSLKLAEQVENAQKTLENYGIVKYNIVFPSSSIIPTITQISKNGGVVCRTEFVRDQYKPLTTAKLTQTFTSITPRTQTLIFHPSQFVQPTQPPARPSPPIQQQRPHYVKPILSSYNNQQNIRPIQVSQPTIPPAQPVQEPRPISFQNDLSSLNIPQKIPTRNAYVNDGIRCGEIPKRNIPLIYQGSAFEEGSWPWLAALFYSSDNGILQFQCGGTVISSNAVLTAAHCFVSRKETDYQIAVGRHNLKKWSRGQTLDVSNIIIHEHFRGIHDIADADIAIVKVFYSISFDTYVRPACILQTETSDSRDIVNELGTVAGWGASEERKLNAEPLKIMVPIISRDICLQEAPKIITYGSQRTFCAGRLDGSGPCTGDSGSGLLINRNDRWWLRGIVSVRPDAKNCSDRSYVLYTDVAQYSNWITTKINVNL